MAPPVIASCKEFIKTSGWSRPGSYLNTQGNSCLIRSDCFVEVGKKFWEEFEQVNAVALYAELVKNNP
ncbi:MAG: hypothetical protein A3F67_11450 [Verrucomicrobia bacterium RIFCSPHIGHO2_12_FULL_41_10]|nr:MAG: hypothetical protein A3F67_11450 [Verrucomicrobia bacterium RIFCSPHIGHO2_12_FULL_41_10]